MLAISRAICQYHQQPLSLIVIIQNHFLYGLNIFIGCWRARLITTRIIIDIFSATLKPIIPQLNLCSAHSRLTKQFTHKIPISDLFLQIVKNLRAYQNRPIIFICQKHTDNPQWLISSTYEYITDMCTKITEKKN